MPEKKVAQGKKAKTKAPIAKKNAPTIQHKAARATNIDVKPAADKKVGAARKRRNKAITGFDELLQKQAELDAIKKRARAEFHKQYEEKFKEAEEIKKQYRELFDEPFDEAPRKATGKKAKAIGLKMAHSRGFSLDQVKSFIEQKESGLEASKIKIAGKNITGVKRIDAAYAKSAEKDAEVILKLLK